MLKDVRIRVIEVPEGEVRENRAIWSHNGWKLTKILKDINSLIQEISWTWSNINTNLSTYWDIIVEHEDERETESRERKIWEAAKEKSHLQWKSSMCLLLIRNNGIVMCNTHQRTISWGSSRILCSQSNMTVELWPTISAAASPGSYDLWNDWRRTISMWSVAASIKLRNNQRAKYTP